MDLESNGNSFATADSMDDPDVKSLPLLLRLQVAGQQATNVN